MNVRAACLGGMLALALLELATRQLYWAPMTHDPDFGAVLQPGLVRWATEGWASSHWTDAGVRHPAPPDPARPTLLALGDSFTEALMVNDREVFTGRLEALLHESGTSWQVLNAGRSGASAADYAALAERYHARFAPRWTLVQIKTGDLGRAAFDPARSHFARAADGRLEVRRVPPQRSRLSERIEPLRAHSALFNYGIVRFKQFHAATAAEPPLFFAAGAPPMRLHPPHDDGRGQPVEEELALLFEAWAGRMTLLLLSEFDPHALGAPSPTEREIDALCAQRGWSCVNLRAAFEEIAARHEAPYGFWNTGWNAGHMNATGHAAAARLLHAELMRLASRDLL